MLMIHLLLKPLRKDASLKVTELSMVFIEYEFEKEKEKEITELSAYKKIVVSKTLEKYFQKDP